MDKKMFRFEVHNQLTLAKGVVIHYSMKNEYVEQLVSHDRR